MGEVTRVKLCFFLFVVPVVTRMCSDTFWSHQTPK
jgi:hypothetical protein